MSLFTASKVLASMSWMRLIRGRTFYITIILALMPIAISAIVASIDKVPPTAAWEAGAEMVFRLVIPLGAAIHVASVVGDELEQRTFTFLWSRPMPRSALVLGRLLVMVPLLFALGAVTLLLVYLVARSPGATAENLGRALGAAGLAAMASGMFAVGAGALVPRQPLLFAIAMVLVVENIIGIIPIVRNLSIIGHSRALAGFDFTASPGGAALGLVLLGAGWLAIGILRVRSAEWAAAKE